MGKPLANRIFISYKRADPTTGIAEQLWKRIAVNLHGHGFADTFFDKKSIEAGEAWSPAIDAALDWTTHFVALLSDDFWLSEQCQRELRGAIERYEQRGYPRLLFVLTELMDPSALLIDADDRGANVVKRIPTVEHLGQISFLGPYDAAGRLIRLSSEKAVLGDQLYQLVSDIKALPPFSVEVRAARRRPKV